MLRIEKQVHSNRTKGRANVWWAMGKAWWASGKGQNQGERPEGGARSEELRGRREEGGARRRRGFAGTKILRRIPRHISLLGEI